MAGILAQAAENAENAAVVAAIAAIAGVVITVTGGIIIAVITHRTRNDVGTPNGRSLGEMVHEMWKSVVHLEAEGHRRDREFRETNTLLREHLDEAKPLAEWVREQMRAR